MKRYLGDSVYVSDEEGGMLTLYTDNGLDPVETIYLEEEVYLALVQFVRDSDTFYN